MRQSVVGLAFALLLAGPSALVAQFDAGIAVGSKAPVVTVNGLDGKPVDFSGYFGKKPVLIEFWATWCPVCKGLLPKLEQLKQTYGDRVVMLGVNITVNDSKERVQRYLAVHKPPFLPLWDDKGVSARAYDVPATSFIVIVDPKGMVVYTGTGADQDLLGAMKKVVGS